MAKYPIAQSLSKSAKIVLSKWIFMSRIIQIILINVFNYIQKISLGAHVFLTKFFDNIKKFKTLYFLKSCPIFDELSFIAFTKYNYFLWVCWSCFLGPTIEEFPQPNWRDTYILCILGKYFLNFLIDYQTELGSSSSIRQVPNSEKYLINLWLKLKIYFRTTLTSYYTTYFVF